MEQNQAKYTLSCLEKNRKLKPIAKALLESRNLAPLGSVSIITGTSGGTQFIVNGDRTHERLDLADPTKGSNGLRSEVLDGEIIFELEWSQPQTINFLKIYGIRSSYTFASTENLNTVDSFNIWLDDVQLGEADLIDYSELFGEKALRFSGTTFLMIIRINFF